MGVVSSSLGLQMGSWGWGWGWGGGRELEGAEFLPDPHCEASGRAQGCPTPRRDSREVPALEGGAEKQPPGGSSSLLSSSHTSELPRAGGWEAAPDHRGGGDGGPSSFRGCSGEGAVGL